MTGPVPAVASGPSVTSQQRLFILVGALLSLLLAALDQTIVSTAGPVIQRSLGIDAALYAWLTTAYLVTSTVMIPIYGKLSDLYGRKGILLFGIAVFLLGSVLCGLSNSALALIVFRGVQGLGGAALFTSVFALIADLFAPAERARYQGLFGAVFGLSSVIGPLAGGLITDALGWHWVFFINLPIGAVALLFIWARMPAMRSVRNAAPIDVWGALWLVVGVVPLLLALSLGKTAVAPGELGYLWTSWPVLGLFGLAGIGVAVFIVTERRARAPIIDLNLFSTSVFAWGNAAAFLLGAAFLAAVVFLPLFMVNVVGLSATNSGLTTTPLTLGVVAGSILSGQLVGRLGRYKVLMLVSVSLLVVGFTTMWLTLTPNSTQPEVTLKMVLLGLGVGPGLPLYTLAIQNAVLPEQTGSATAIVTFLRSLGQVIGVALIGTVFAGALSSRLPANLAGATRALPPAVRAQLGAAPALAWNAAQVRARVAADFARQRVQANQALSGDAAARQALRRSPLTAPAVRAALATNRPALVAASLAAAEQQALAGVGRVDAAFKRSYTDAITRVYASGAMIVLLALLCTACIPELPLRKAAPAAPAPDPI